MAWEIKDGLIIGETPINANLKANIETKSTTKGWLPNRLTTVQRLAIAGLGALDKGLFVFDTTTNTYWFWNGSAWVEFAASSGGGGVVETNIISVGANYNVLFTNYIIVATANCTLFLPQILTNIGVVFRIFSNGFNVRVDAFAGDTINSETMQNLSGFEMFTLRSLLSNKWLIGD